MNSVLRLILRAASRLVPTSLLCASALAQDSFTVSDLTVSSPLTVMSGEDFVAESTLVGGSVIEATGGDFVMEAAVTPLSVDIMPGDVTVSLAVEGDNLVLTWPEAGANFILESTVALDAVSDWQPVQPTPSQRRFVTPLTQSAVFFRLRRM